MISGQSNRKNKILEVTCTNKAGMMEIFMQRTNIASHIMVISAMRKWPTSLPQVSSVQVEDCI